MLRADHSLPPGLTLKLKKFFSERDIKKSLINLKNGHVSLSFIKGSLNKYCIISGITRDGGTLVESRLTIKQVNEKEQLTSLCECLHWKSTDHCSHVCSLFLKYLLEQTDGQVAHFGSPLSPLDNPPAKPTFLGEIIYTPQMISSLANSTFSTIQYKLISGTTISFPIPGELKGRLRLNLEEIPSALEVNEDEDIYELPRFYRPLFSYIDNNGSEQKNISILNHLYLFNWETGKAYHLPPEIKDLVVELKKFEQCLTLDDYLRIFSRFHENKIAELYFKGRSLFSYDKKPANLRISIHPHVKKKNSLTIDLEIFDENEKLLPIPLFLLIFAFKNGLLSSFKKKTDAYNFLKSLFLFFSEEEILAEQKNSYKSLIRLSNEREILSDYVQFMEKSEHLTLFNEDDMTLYSLDSVMIKSVFATFMDLFGEFFYRFSSYNSAERKISFDVSSSTFLTNISALYDRIHIFGVLLYYDRNEIKTWSSRIKFERKNAHLSWFDLQLNIDNDDLKFISNVDLENRHMITDKGLTLIKNDQKDLIRFLRKYAKFDNKVENPDPENEPIPEEDNRFVVPFNRARIFELFEIKKLGIDGALTPEELDICNKILTIKDIPNYPVPHDLEKIARPYQITGYRWLRFLYENKLGACLADDMGLGKTLQTIMFIKSIYEKIDRVLIVCPVSILINWQNEFNKFSDISIDIYYGGNRNVFKNSKVIITSYGVMKKEIDSFFSQEHFDILIMDEVHHLKNLRSLGAIAARKVRADYRIALTGTPVENDLSEFYNIIDLCIPGIWGDIQFVRTIANKHSRGLAKKTSRPFILRRTKAQVLTDLPPKQENHIYLNFTDEERERYDSTLLKIRSKIKNVIPRKRYGEILKGLLELRQLCLWQRQQQIESTKIDFLIEMLEQIVDEGHQVLIFSQFTTYLDIIQERFNQLHWTYCRIDGTQGHKKRQSQIDNFQSGKTPLFLISLKAGGVGLNLTAASYIFLMDPWWNPAVEAQAIDRAHRIGQKNNLTVYRPIVKNSVEEKILKLQETKRELFHDLMNNEQETFFTGKLTIDDFEGLFY